MVTTPAMPLAPAPEDRAITADELSRHSARSDAWIAVQGKVYDVTAWLAVHPGGDIPILSLAGQDATDAFIAYHPPSAWPLLSARLPLVGRLADYKVSDVSRDYRRIAADLHKAGLFDQKGHGAATSLATMVTTLAAAVAAVLFTDSVVAHLAGAALLGMLWMQSGYLGHDSGHYTIMPSKSANRAVQIVAGNCVAGISIGWWKRQHNAHHIACNSLEFDPDLQHIPLFAVSPLLFRSLRSAFYNRIMRFTAAARFLIAYQHWTFYPVMCIARVNLFAQSILLLLSPVIRVPGRFSELAGIAVFWMWFPLLVFQLSTAGERVAFVLLSFAVTGIQHIQFCLNHFSARTYVGHPRGDDWFEKQTWGTIDITCPPWMDWFHGGLQFQVEHHLFPRLPRCHLRRISPLVKELCAKHGLPYTACSFWDANRRTIATLREAAMAARKLGDGAENLVWEAFNTVG